MGYPTLPTVNGHTNGHDLSSLPPFPEDIDTAPLVTLTLAKLLASDPSETDALFKASRELGFFYLDMRGAPQGEAMLAGAQALLQVGKQLFELPLEEKLKYDQLSRNTFFGYKGLGASVIDKKGTLDRIEVFSISKDNILGNAPPLDEPDLVHEYKPLFESYIRAACSIVDLLLIHLNTHLRLPPGTLTNLHRINEQSGDHVRFVRSPPQPVDDRRTALGEHTDFGSLTILFNWLGGLQVQLPGTTKWVYVRPVPGCAIVNLGDAMVKFTAGIMRSNIHRVVNPPGAQADETRYSLVYFSRPEDAVPLKRVKGGMVDEQPATVDEDITSKEWILRRGLGNYVGKFKGPEDWERNRGTEAGRQ